MLACPALPCPAGLRLTNHQGIQCTYKVNSWVAPAPDARWSRIGRGQQVLCAILQSLVSASFTLDAAYKQVFPSPLVQSLCLDSKVEEVQVIGLVNGLMIAAKAPPSSAHHHARWPSSRSMLDPCKSIPGPPKTPPISILSTSFLRRSHVNVNALLERLELFQ